MPYLSGKLLLLACSLVLIASVTFAGEKDATVHNPFYKVRLRSIGLLYCNHVVDLCIAFIYDGCARRDLREDGAFGR